MRACLDSFREGLMKHLDDEVRACAIEAKSGRADEVAGEGPEGGELEEVLEVRGAATAYVPLRLLAYSLQDWTALDCRRLHYDLRLCAGTLSAWMVLHVDC